MSSTGGMNDDAPMPSTSCGPASPPLRIDPCGSTTTHQQFGLRSFRYLATPVNVPPVPAPASQASTRPSICSQISATGRLVVRLGVVRIRELLRDVGVLDRLRQLLRFRDRAFHPVVLRREDDFAAERFHHFALFRGEVFGDAEDDAIAHARAGQREGDAGVAGGRLDDRAAFLRACHRARRARSCRRRCGL